MSDAAVQSSSFPYPGSAGTGDGTSLVVHVETRATQAAAAYPITSSTNMAVGYQQAVADGATNVWGEPLGWMELESEHSSATACEGFALAGGRVTNFTSGQGLVLMKEVLFTISGKRLPCVFNIASRALTSHALNVHAGHDDIMAVADTGWGMLIARNVQEAGDLCLIARRTAERTRTPFLNVQDGFLTSHTIENCVFPEDDLIRDFLGAPADNIRALFDSEYPLMTGTVQNQDSYMQGKIAQRAFYDAVPPTLAESMDEFYRLTGRRYGLIETVAMDDADYALIAMGSTAETAIASIEHIRDIGIHVGVINVTSFRPFPARAIADALKHVRAAAVIERMDAPLACDNPLTAEIEAALAKGLMHLDDYPHLDAMPVVYSGCAGLGGRDVTAGHMVAVANNMYKGVANGARRFFTLGIEHPTALPVAAEPDVRPDGAFSIRGHSVGGYGSVTTNKIIAKCLGDVFGFPVQASPKYGSEKKGLPTNTYLTTTGHDKILTHSELTQVEFVPLMDPNTWNMGNPLVGLTRGGTVFQHTDRETPEELWDSIPAWAKYVILEDDLHLWGVDTVRIARDVCKTDPSLIQRFQGIVLLGVFLRLTPFRENAGMSEDEMFARVRAPLEYYFGKRGDVIVEENLAAARRGYTEVFEAPRAVMEATPPEVIAEGKRMWDEKGQDTNAFFI